MQLIGLLLPHRKWSALIRPGQRNTKSVILHLETTHSSKAKAMNFLNQTYTVIKIEWPLPRLEFGRHASESWVCIKCEYENMVLFLKPTLKTTNQTSKHQINCWALHYNGEKIKYTLISAGKVICIRFHLQTLHHQFRY